MANFTLEQKKEVWKKAKTVNGIDPNKYRQDSAGAWMQWDKYGTAEDLGWEIDHMFPEALGGDDELHNLQAMQWENNRTKADNFPKYSTSVSSNGNNYQKETNSWKFSDTFIALMKTIYRNNSALQKIA